MGHKLHRKKTRKKNIENFFKLNPEIEENDQTRLIYNNAFSTGYNAGRRYERNKHQTIPEKRHRLARLNIPKECYVCGEKFENCICEEEDLNKRNCSTDSPEKEKGDSA